MNNFVFHPETTQGYTPPKNRTAPQTGPASPPASPEVSHDDIARRAYEIYVKSGSKNGRCRQNWQQAENELRKPAVAAASLKLTESLPAARASLEPGVKVVAGAFPSIMGGRGPARRGTPSLPPGNRNPRV